MDHYHECRLKVAHVQGHVCGCGERPTDPITLGRIYELRIALGYAIGTLRLHRAVLPKSAHRTLDEHIKALEASRDATIEGEV